MGIKKDEEVVSGLAHLMGTESRAAGTAAMKDVYKSGKFHGGLKEPSDVVTDLNKMDFGNDVYMKRLEGYLKKAGGDGEDILQQIKKSSDFGKNFKAMSSKDRAIFRSARNEQKYGEHVIEFFPTEMRPKELSSAPKPTELELEKYTRDLENLKLQYTAISDSKKFPGLKETIEGGSMTKADIERTVNEVFSTSNGLAEGRFKKLSDNFGDFIASKPRLSTLVGGVLGTYLIITMMSQNDEECQDACQTGDVVWVSRHDNYDDFCHVKQEPKCIDYCNPELGGSVEAANLKGDEAACSERSRTHAAIERLEAMVGHVAEEAGDFTWEMVKGFLMSGPGQIILWIFGVICCGIVSLVIIRMIMGAAIKKTGKVMLGMKGTTAGNILEESGKMAKSLVTAPPKPGTSGGGGKNYNKTYLLIIFFIFIIYNELYG